MSQVLKRVFNGTFENFQTGMNAHPTVAITTKIALEKNTAKAHFICGPEIKSKELELDKKEPMKDLMLKVVPELMLYLDKVDQTSETAAKLLFNLVSPIVALDEKHYEDLDNSSETAKQPFWFTLQPVINDMVVALKSLPIEASVLNRIFEYKNPNLTELRVFLSGMQNRLKQGANVLQMHFDRNGQERVALTSGFEPSYEGFFKSNAGPSISVVDDMFSASYITTEEALLEKLNAALTHPNPYFAIGGFETSNVINPGKTLKRSEFLRDYQGEEVESLDVLFSDRYSNDSFVNYFMAIQAYDLSQALNMYNEQKNGFNFDAVSFSGYGAKMLENETFKEQLRHHLKANKEYQFQTFKPQNSLIEDFGRFVIGQSL